MISTTTRFKIRRLDGNCSHCKHSGQLLPGLEVVTALLNLEETRLTAGFLVSERHALLTCPRFVFEELHYNQHDHPI